MTLRLRFRALPLPPPTARRLPTAASCSRRVAPSYRSLASLQQGSTLQLLPYYPVVGEEAKNMMRYAIIAQKPAPIPSIDIPLRFR